MTKKTIAFIGSGNMASSLIGGLVADGYNPRHLVASDSDGEKLANLAARYGIQAAADNLHAAGQAEVIVLAVKPQVLKGVAQELAATVQSRRPLVISIVAGVREQDLQTWLGGNVALVRTMPNTPAMIQSGATALHAGKGVSEEQKNLAESILRAVGLTCWVSEEAAIDAVTALSGSGPAYFFLVMEAMEEAGKSLGLSDETARLLTLQTALGAARMAMESSDSPALLREKVTSRGGTTERALGILREGGLQELFKQAVSGAHDRSIELSELLGDA
jgi:pyrroline-5-carboxylate reductase